MLRFFFMGRSVVYYELWATRPLYRSNRHECLGSFLPRLESIIWAPLRQHSRLAASKPVLVELVEPHCC